MLTYMKRKARAVREWFTPRDERLVKAADDMAAAAAKMAEARHAIDGLHRAIGLLERERRAADSEAMLTIAALLTALGGSATVAKPVIEALYQADFNIQYAADDLGAVTATLVMNEPPAAAVAPDPDQTGDYEAACDCACGDQVVS